MLNKELGSWPLGPEGRYGVAKIAIVEGKIVTSVEVSAKGILDSVAKEIGGPVAGEVANFLETAVGLS